MEIILKTLAEAPFVALFAYLWWTARKDYLKEKNFLEERIREKDAIIKEFTGSFAKLSMALELIKDRLR